MGKDGKSDSATRNYVKKYKITLQHLLDSAAVTGKLKSLGLTQEDLDGLYRYFIAGGKLYPEDFNYRTKA